MEVIRTDITQFNHHPRIPARLILTPQNLTVYESEFFDSIIFKSSLRDLKFFESLNDRCFSLLNCISGKKIDVCSMQGSSINFKAEWVNDIRFFRDKCGPRKKIARDSILEMKKRALEEMEMEEREVQGDGREEEEARQLREKLEKLQKIAILVILFFYL